MIPAGWVMTPFSEWTGVPTFTTVDRASFPWEASAFFSEGMPEHPGPFIMLRPKYVKIIQRSLNPRRKVNLSQASAWTILANEYNHATGRDQTDVGGFTGGMGNWKATRRAMIELMTKAGLKPARQKRLLRLAKQSMGTLRNVHPPSTPAPSTTPPGVIPTIGL